MLNSDLLVSIVIVLGVFAALRILVGLTFANLHELRTLKQSKQNDRALRHRSFSIMIPAYNESKSIKASVLSALALDYDDFEVIVINDGSKDDTLAQLRELQKEHANLVITDQPNGGKSVALNNALVNYAHNELVMVLDADSVLSTDALVKMNRHFQSDKTVAVAANVRINSAPRFLEYVQMVEYYLGYHLKNSEIPLNIQYIIGGIGSCFRRDKLIGAGGYDSDTVTEDIDLTMKLLHYYGNAAYHFGYANDVIAYTPAVHTFRELLKQRLRWKYGRFKALIKYRSMIFSHDPKYSRTLSWWKLPKIWVEEFLMFLEPFFVLLALYCVAVYGDFSTYISIVSLYTIYAALSFINADKLSHKDKLMMFLTTPFTFLFLEVISVVDYVSLIKCIIHRDPLFRQESSWEHVERWRLKRLAWVC